VIGVPHDELGEEVAAAVALKDGAETTAADIRSFVKERVAGRQVPTPRLARRRAPEGPTGKILKRKIRPPGVLCGS
jgi:long-chain acyl-CoA synthetase